MGNKGNGQPQHLIRQRQRLDEYRRGSRPGKALPEPEHVVVIDVEEDREEGGRRVACRAGSAASSDRRTGWPGRRSLSSTRRVAEHAAGAVRACRRAAGNGADRCASS